MPKTIIEQKESARMAIEGAMNDPYIMKQLEIFGYNRKKLLEGRALCEKVNLLDNNLKQEHSGQLKATDTVYAAFDDAFALYMKHVKIARLAVPHDRELWKMLELSGSRKRNITGWLYQAQTFYMNTEILREYMETFNVMEEELLQAKAMVEAVGVARVKQQADICDTRMARKQRDEALQTLCDWHRKFVVVAKVALDLNREKLNAMGI